MTTSLLSLIVAFLVCVSLIAASPAPAATKTLPPKGAATVGTVKVDNPDVDTEGNGCRAGSVGAAFAKDSE